MVDGKVVLNNGLTIGRATYGSVFWPGRIELENVALDEVGCLAFGFFLQFWFMLLVSDCYIPPQGGYRISG